MKIGARSRPTITLDQAARVLKQAPQQNQGDRVTLGGGSLGSPALVPDGVCHSSGSRVACYDRQGNVRWSYDLKHELSAVTADAQGRTYVCSNDGYLHGFAADGERLFKPIAVDVNARHAPAAAADGSVYIATQNAKLEGYTPEGKLKFSTKIKKTSLKSLLGLEERHLYSTTPTVTTDGKVVVANEKNYVTAFNSKGERVWTYRLPQQSMTGISAGANGTVGLGIFLDEAVVLDRKGRQLARQAMGGPCVSSGVAVAPNGDFVAGDSSGMLAAWDSSGRAKWVVRSSEKFTGTPVFKDGNLYATTWFGKFYTLDAATGQKKFSTSLGGSLSMSSPRIDEDGTAYISLTNGLIALRTRTKEPEYDVEKILRETPPPEAEIEFEEGWLVVGDTALNIN